MPRIPWGDMDRAFMEEAERERRARQEYGRVPSTDEMLEKPYIILRMRNLDAMEAQVAKMIALGMRPAGGVQVVYRQVEMKWEPVTPEAWYLQAMVAGHEQVMNGSKEGQKEVT